MRYENTSQLRKWLDPDFPVLAAMDFFEVEEEVFRQALNGCAAKPQSEQRDGALFRCLTFNVQKEKPKETKPEHILLQQDQILKAHQLATQTQSKLFSEIGESVTEGLGEVSVNLAEIQSTALIATETILDRVTLAFNGLLGEIDRQHAEQDRKAVEDRLIASKHREIQVQEWNNAKLLRAKNRKIAVVLGVIFLLLWYVDFSYGMPSQNVNSATVVAVCGTPPNPFPAAGNPARVTVDVNGNICSTATIAPSGTQNVNIVGMSTGVFPITTGGQSSSNAMAIQGVTGGIPAPVSPLNDTVRISGVASGIVVPISGLNDTVRISGVASGITIPTSGLNDTVRISGLAVGLTFPVSPTTPLNVTIGGIGSGITIPTSSNNDTIRIGGIASGITIPVSATTPLTMVGTGLVGTATAQALTIQGSPTGVAVPVSETTPLTIVTTGLVGTATAQALTIQGSATGVAIPVSEPQAMAGTSTNSAITVQGNASGIALPVQIMGMATISGNITSSVNQNVSVSLIAGVGSNYFYLSSCSFNNTSATATLVYLLDGNNGNTIWPLMVPATTGGNNVSWPAPGMLKVPTVGNGLFFKPATTGAGITGGCAGVRSTTSF